MAWLPRLFGKKVPAGAEYQVTERELIQKESQIGSGIFGFVPPNHRREFFMLDQHTWIWYEEWRDAKGPHRVTTRYEIHGPTIIKIQNDQPAVTLQGEELENFYQAVKSYYYAVADKVYHRPIPA